MRISTLAKAARLLRSAVVASLIGLPALADDRPDLTVAVNALPNSLESIEEQGNVAVRITYTLFDSLIRRDFLADGSGTSAVLVPGLAESWTRVDDRTMDFKLREGVKFHNGDELTSDDVAFSLVPGRGAGQNPIFGEAKTYMNTISHVIPLDRYNVRIVSKEPDILMEQRIAGYSFWIVNAREYLTVGYEAFRRKPVGTGPYKVEEWVDGEYLKLVAHDDYFGGKPTAASITYRVVPEVSARIAGLVSGEYDIAVNIPPDQVATIRSYDDLPPGVADRIGRTGEFSVDAKDGPIIAQSWYVLDRIRATIEDAGGSMADVFKLVQYFRNLDHFPRYNAVRRTFFPDTPPVSTVVEVSAMMPGPEILIEVEATAWLGARP